jgi:hypothetical protein
MAKDVFVGREGGYVLFGIDMNNIGVARKIGLCCSGQNGLERSFEGETFHDHTLGVIDKESNSQGGVKLRRCEGDQVVDIMANIVAVSAKQLKLI